MRQSAPSRWQQVCGSLERVAGIVNDAIEALDLTGVTLVGSDTGGGSWLSPGTPGDARGALFARLTRK